MVILQVLIGDSLVVDLRECGNTEEMPTRQNFKRTSRAPKNPSRK
jgi:hypothetical protein